jgi:hypothetical protein
MNLIPGTLPTINLRRGMWRQGFRLALKDEDGDPAAFVSDWTPHLQVRNKAGGTLLLTIACSMDGAEVVVPGFSVPEDLRIGTWPIELAFTDDEGRKRGPYAEGKVNVNDVVTLPND